MAIERLTIANYDNLENKPIAAKNLATETVEDNNYYLNKAAEKLVYTENPTNPDGSTIDKIYYNMNMSADDVGQSLIDMPWDTALVQDIGGTNMRFLQLIGADTAENSGRGIYATKMTFPTNPAGDLYYIIAGESSFESEPQLLFIYSADFGPEDMDGPDAWGWINYETFEPATASPLGLLEGYTFTFNYIANKECWDTWFSTSNEFASSFDFEANTLYKRVGKAYKKIDGNVLEPVDKLPQPTEALKGRVVYNKKDNQIYECKEVTGGITETPISYESLLPLRCEWDSCGASGSGTFFVNTDLDSDTVKAIFAGDNSGTLITAYDSCNIASYYVSYQHSGNELQIIDNTDTCSPRTIFDSSLGGWQESSTAGWIPAEDGKYDYPRYTLKSEYNRYNMSLSSTRSPQGCLFSTSDGGFVGYKIVDGIYFNVHEKFDGSKMFADSSYPVIYLAIADTTKQLSHYIMLVNSAAMGEGYEQAGWMILAGDENGNYYPIYVENAFDWSSNSDGPQMVVTTAGWQSEYVDLATGKLKLPANGSISDVGRSMMLISESSDITEDLLGDYVAGTPFTKIEGVYKWSNLAKSGEETLKLSGEAYKIIQPTSGDLTITESDGAENVIILGTISGTLTIENRAVRQLTYIGNCDNLYIDLRDWGTYSSSEYPVINLIGEGTAVIYGSRMDVTATDTIRVEESDDGTSAYKYCNIKAGKNITYKFNVGNKSYHTQQPARFECNELTIEDLTNDYSSVCRLIDAHCNFLTINGSTTFLENGFNKNGSNRTMGSELVIHAPSLSRAGGDNCTAARYAGPASDLGGYHLFATYDSCTSTYNRTWKTIQEYVDEKAGDGSSRLTKRTQQYASSWYSDGSGGYKCTFYTTEQNSDLVFISPASNSPSLYGVYGASKSGTTIYLHSDSSSVTSGPSLLFNITVVPCEENSYGAVFYKDENANEDDSPVSASPTILASSSWQINPNGGYAGYPYLNKYFPQNFDSSVSMSGEILLKDEGTGGTIRIDYTAHDPSSLHIYRYDTSYNGGGITDEVYKDGAWVYNTDWEFRYNGASMQLPDQVSANAARVIPQLFSGNNVTWTYIPLADVTDSIIPPNLCDNYLSYSYNSTTTGSFVDIDSANGGGSKVLYQCVWEGNLTWGGSEHAVRVAFRPIWSNFRSTGPIIFTSESIGGNTLTLTSQIDEAGYYPKLVLMLNDGSTPAGGTLYWKRLYNI